MQWLSTNRMCIVFRCWISAYSTRRGKLMKKLIATFGVLGACFASSLAEDGKKKIPDPIARKDAILKTFVEEFVAITPGKGKFPESFMMGTKKGGNENESPAHKVTFKYSFAMAKYEVT